MRRLFFLLALDLKKLVRLKVGLYNQLVVVVELVGSIVLLDLYFPYSHSQNTGRYYHPSVLGT